MNPIAKLCRLAPLALLLGAAACQNDHDGNPATPDLAFEKTFSLRFPQAYATDITELTDGSLFVLAGTDDYSSASQYRIMGVKLSATGDTIWTKTYGLGTPSPVGFVLGCSALPTTDGNLVVAGVSDYSNHQQTVVEKLNSTTGAVVWHFEVPAMLSAYVVCKIAPTADGGFLVLSRAAADEQHFSVHRITGTGTLTATTDYPGEVISDIRPTADGNFIIAGVNSPLQRRQPFLTKVTAQGTALWTRTPGATNFGINNSVVQTPDGGYAVASGSAYSVADIPLQLLKTDATGQQQSVSTIAPDIQGYANRLDVGPGNTLLLAGGKKIIGSVNLWDSEPLFLRLSATGAELERTTKPTPGEIASFRPTRNGGLVFCSTEADKIVVRRTGPALLP